MHGKRPAGAPTDPVLTARLVLTPVGAGDVDDLLRLYSDPALAYWTGPWTRTAVEAWAADMADRWAAEGVGKWMARDRSDGSLVGRGGFTRIDLDGEAVLELGWAVRDARTSRTSGPHSIRSVHSAAGSSAAAGANSTIADASDAATNVRGTMDPTLSTVEFRFQPPRPPAPASGGSIDCAGGGSRAVVGGKSHGSGQARPVADLPLTPPPGDRPGR